MTQSAGRGGNGDSVNGGGSGSGGDRTAGLSRRGESAPEASELLPLTEPVFHILLALAERDLHGYGIILAVQNATAGKLRLRTGTLYTAMPRLVEDGLIEEIESDDADAEEDRRRVYRLTPFGRAVASAESVRVANLTALARARGLISRRAPRRR
jgi:DNA-binding MarR family transcriptional regulator